MVTLEAGKYGVRAVVRSPLSESDLQELLSTQVAELELNDGKGWRGTDLSFLERLPHLKSLKIIDLRIQAVDGIHTLHELRALEVITYCRSAIEFATFPCLEECSIHWRPRAASIFGCATLKRLFIDGYDGRDVTAFGQLSKLESLAILNAPLESLQGVGSLTKLRKLRLGNLKRLRSLVGIEGLWSLEELDINTCPAIHSIDQVSQLAELKILLLNNVGDIESLKPLARLEKLETVLFYESTNIVDGDLSPLLNKSKLSRVSFRNRRHYSQRREEFGAAYSS
jgi:hypothetical protein